MTRQMRQATLQKLKYIALFFLICFSFKIFAEDPTGFWQTLDKKTGLPSSVIAVYSYQGKYYGRIVATCNQQGVVSETIYNPQSRAPGVMGNPFYCGLDIIWACANDGRGIYKGSVIDPRDGNKYTAKIWQENGNLILRGEVLMFGRNETLTRFPSQQFNQNFAQPNVSTFIPAQCRLRHQSFMQFIERAKQLRGCLQSANG